MHSASGGAGKCGDDAAGNEGKNPFRFQPRRGTFAHDNDYYKWFNTVKLNTIERRDITISLLNEEHMPVVVWKVKSAWPVKVQSPDLKADANESAIESIEVAHEGLVIDNA